jgi:hypothetical protein
MIRKILFTIGGIITIAFLGIFLVKQVRIGLPAEAQDVGDIVAIPTVGVFDNQNLFEGSARRRIPFKLRKSIRSVYNSKEKIKVELDNSDVNLVELTLRNDRGDKVEVEVAESDVQGITTLTISPPNQFKPGKFKLTLTDQTGATIEQDFLWGVLALNPDKTVYLSGETASFSMAVLNELGKMVCDAKLVLKITFQTGQVNELSTDNGKIIVNPECDSHEYTLKPDYEAKYLLDNVGSYGLELMATTGNGTYTISDRIEVKNAVEFDVSRLSATRIYPVNIYPMTITIKANEDFNGNVYEEVPTNFVISQPSGDVQNYSLVNTEDNVQKITWKVDLKKGDKINLGYRYKAPNISPQFYLTGPLMLASLTDLAYNEGRQWQIAVDAVGGIRQEINIINGSIGVTGTDAAIVNLDTTKYNGATYYFEVYANKGAGSTLTINLSTGNTNTTSIGITNTTDVLVRRQFTPETGSFDYRLNLTTGSTPAVKAARIIILQSADPITDTQTQIEIGNLEVGKTMLSTRYLQPAYHDIGVGISGTSTASPTWPTHAIGDIALLFVESTGQTTVTLSTPNGFEPVTNSPQPIGVGNTSGTKLSVFWARATNTGMSAPVIMDPGDHIIAQIVTYSNCAIQGLPFDVSVGSTQSVGSTKTTWDSVTTTVDNTLVVLAATRDNDGAAGAAWGDIANPNLTNITERKDSGSASGNGGGMVIADGVLATAGVGGTSSATVNATVLQAEMTIALKGAIDTTPVQLVSPKYWKYDSSVWDAGTTFSAETTWKKTDTGLAAPTFQAEGTFVAASGGTLTVTVPAGYQDNDVFMLFVESTNDTITVLSSGWTQVADSPKGTGTAGAAGGVRLAVYYKIVSGAQSSVGVSTAVNNHAAIIANFRGVDTAAPINASVGKTDSVATTIVEWPVVTTTVDNTLIVNAAGLDKDLADSDTLTTMWANSDIINLTERHDQTVTAGAGGGVAYGTGVMAESGTMSDDTTVVADTSTTHAYLTIALKGINIDTTPQVTTVLQEDDGNFANWATLATIGNTMADSGVVTRTRSATFTPTATGRHYRLAGGISNSRSHSIAIYNAKIIADQSGIVNKLEPQYLLLNTKSTAVGGTLGYPTLWDSSEWTTYTSVFKHATDAIGAGASASLVDISNSNAGVTNSAITGANQVMGNGMTMPITGHKIDTWLQNAGTEVDASRILAQVVLNAPPPGPIMEQVLRHGSWFINGIRQAFTF